MLPFDSMAYLIRKSYYWLIRFLVRYWYVSPISTANQLDVDCYPDIAAAHSEFHLPPNQRDAFFHDVDGYLCRLVSSRTQMPLVDARLMTFDDAMLFEDAFEQAVPKRPIIEVLVCNHTLYITLFHAMGGHALKEHYHRKVYSWRDGTNRRARYLGHMVGKPIQPVNKDDCDYIFNPNQPTIAYKERIGPDHPLYEWCSLRSDTDLFDDSDTHTEG